MRKNFPIWIKTGFRFSVNHSTFRYMAVMTLTALCGLYGFVILHDEQAGLILTFAGYITGIIGMMIWNRYRPVRS